MTNYKKAMLIIAILELIVCALLSSLKNKEEAKNIAYPSGQD